MNPGTDYTVFVLLCNCAMLKGLTIPSSQACLVVTQCNPTAQIKVATVVIIHL